MRRSALITCSVLLFVGLGIGALWAAKTETDSRSAAVASELEALRASEAERRTTSAAVGAPGGATPSLCGKLAVDTYGTVADASLEELSGLVASRRSPTTFWALEDSGAAPVLTALRGSGSAASSWAVSGAENVDWEDLAAGPGPRGPVLYAADIGDNDAVRKSISIYRVREPRNPAGSGQTGPAQRLELTYPDGAHDAETLLVDPQRGTLVIVTKGLTGGTAYAVNPTRGFAGRATLRKVGPVSIPLATAGDVAAGGKVIAVRGYFSVSVWARRGDEAITQTLRREPCTSPTALSDGQGETLALSKAGTTAWTVPEGVRPKIQRLRPAG